MMLSGRMEAIVSLVKKTPSLADIGCDHGYVSIALVERGIADRVLAMDVRRGPLRRAKENVAARRLEDRIEIRLSDGLEKLLPGEVQTIVIAGMGGETMLSILCAHPEILASCSQLVLQPQSEIAKVREAVFSLGFAIDAEEMTEEDGKHYMMFSCVPCRTLPEEQAKPWEDPVEYRYGRYLLECRHPVLKAFLEKAYRKFAEILAALEADGEASEKRLSRIRELMEEQKYREEALSCYEMS